MAARLTLLAVALVSFCTAQPFCQFALPSTSQPNHECATFDLADIAHGSGFNISADGTVGWNGGDTYLLTICDNIKTDIPIACYNAAPSPAYFFNTNGTCYSLGKLENFSVVRDYILFCLHYYKRRVV